MTEQGARKTAPALPGGIESNRKRDAEIRALWATGRWTQSAIARKYRLTDARIWQIVNKRTGLDDGTTP